MWFQPIVVSADGEAAGLVAIQGGLALSLGLMLFLPAGWYKFYHLKSSGSYEQVSETSEGDLSALKIEMGAHIIAWAICTRAALVAGGSAEIICALQSVPMIALIAYFLRVRERMWALVSFAFVLAFCYLGFSPSLTGSAVKWQAASIFTCFQSIVSLMTAICFVFGKTEPLYKSQPLTQTWCSTRDREVLLGTTLLGIAAAQMGAVLSNVSSEFCLLAAPGFLVTGIGHWISTGDKKNAMTNWVVMLLFFGFWLFPRLVR